MEAPNSLHSNSSDSFQDTLEKRKASTKSKPHDYFSKGKKELSKEELNQINCINRLSNAKSVSSLSNHRCATFAVFYLSIIII
jgi:hypothetical protein